MCVPVYVRACTVGQSRKVRRSCASERRGAAQLLRAPRATRSSIVDRRGMRVPRTSLRATSERASERRVVEVSHAVCADQLLSSPHDVPARVVGVVAGVSSLSFLLFPSGLSSSELAPSDARCACVNSTASHKGDIRVCPTQPHNTSRQHAPFLARDIARSPFASGDPCPSCACRCCSRKRAQTNGRCVHGLGISRIIIVSSS